MNGLPQDYLSPLHLPFNRECLQGRFSLLSPDQDPGTPGVWVVLQGASLLVRPDLTHALPRGEVPGFDGLSPLYLGQWEGVPCRLVTLPGDAPLPEGLEKVRYAEDNPQLPIELLTLAGLGRAVSHWERSSGYCPTCGEAMTRLPGEWGKNCPVCATHHFPQIHPCAIVLVRRPGEILLTRKPNWAPNRYSLVAGFMEFGECLEETAVREVVEETGVAINNLRYLGSQSWPFPAQLMCGFVADYAGGKIVVDTSELEDVRWFSVDDLPTLPPKRSIARYIIDTVLSDGC